MEFFFLQPPYLHLDFNRWKDEDDSEDDEITGFDDGNLEDVRKWLKAH